MEGKEKDLGRRMVQWLAHGLALVEFFVLFPDLCSFRCIISAVSSLPSSAIALL